MAKSDTRPHSSRRAAGYDVSADDRRQAFRLILLSSLSLNPLNTQRHGAFFQLHLADRDIM